MNIIIHIILHVDVIVAKTGMLRILVEQHIGKPIGVLHVNHILNAKNVIQNNKKKTYLFLITHTTVRTVYHYANNAISTRQHLTCQYAIIVQQLIVSTVIKKWFRIKTIRIKNVKNVNLSVASVKYKKPKKQIHYAKTADNKENKI